MAIDPIALYHPYIHVRDDTWLKYAALYWPKLSRLRPQGYSTHDSDVAQRLQDEGWLIDIAPEPAASRVQQLFHELLDQFSLPVRRRYSLDRITKWQPQQRFTRSTFNSYPLLDDVPNAAYVHHSKISSELSEQLLTVRLAVTANGRNGPWLGMHPDLASIYSYVLSEQVAKDNHLHLVTDQESTHSIMFGWTTERLAEALLDERLASTPQPGEPLNLFVLMAFQTIIPDNLENVPIEKIWAIRTRFGMELIAFRDYVETQVKKLSEIRDVQDLAVFREYVHNEVQRNIAAKLAELRTGLRKLGLESARGIANIKSVALPPVAVATAEAAGLTPTITTSAVLAACLVGVPAKLRSKRRETIKESPVGYLFQMREAVKPAGVVRRISQSLRAV